MMGLKLSDVFWLAQEIWPWTLGLFAVGILINFLLLKRPFGLVVGVIVALSLVISVVFQFVQGWASNPYGFVGVALVMLTIFPPAFIDIMFGALVCRGVGLLIVRPGV
jgi:hypothetical protein